METENRFYEILNTKNFNKENIDFIVRNFYNGKISDELMSKFLFWVCENGLDEKQTVDLTSSMMSEGEILDQSALSLSVDKHSTGGVSDSTTLIVVPLFALLGFHCYKMSGGALGHTGGTADKLQVFKGINIELSSAKAIKITNKTGGCFSCQTKDIAPIDKKIYALRNRIGAVMSIPLIASSIMSKKLALGAKNIVLDVKYGNGALICDKSQSEILAKLMCKIGNDHGRNTKYVLGNMNQPLGNAVGDYYEVMEVLNLLSNFEDCELVRHSIELVCQFSDLVGKTKQQCYDFCLSCIKDGRALEKLSEIVKMQGGQMPQIENIKNIDGIALLSKKSGIIKGVDTQKLGNFFHKYKETVAGGLICKRLEDKIEVGECLVKVFAKNLSDDFVNELYSVWEIE